ncbi:unnamed protein product [Ectocarpus sp. 8 AP-2014]
MSVPWPHVVLFASMIMIMSCRSLPGCCYRQRKEGKRRKPAVRCPTRHQHMYVDEA